MVNHAMLLKKVYFGELRGLRVVMLLLWSVELSDPNADVCNSPVTPPKRSPPTSRSRLLSVNARPLSAAILTKICSSGTPMKLLPTDSEPT